MNNFPDVDYKKCQNEPEIIVWAILQKNKVDDCPKEMLQKACYNICVDTKVLEVAGYFRKHFETPKYRTPYQKLMNEAIN